MKKLLFTIALTLSSILYSQVINWSGILKNDNGEPIENTNVTLTFSILENGTNNLIYTENHSTQTNSSGFIHSEIGNGNVISGDFASIDWSQKYDLKIEFDAGNGNVVLGTSEMKSVPYANASLVSKEIRKDDNGIYIDEANNKMTFYVNGDGGVLSLENDGQLGISSLEGVDEADVSVTADGHLKRKEPTTLTHYFSISAMDFIGEDFLLGTNGIFSNTPGFNESFPQAIHLPDNAVVKNVKAVYLDNSITEVNLILYKYTNGSPALSILMFSTLPHGGADFQTIDIPTMFTINNLNESYGVMLSSDNWEANATKVGIKRIVITYEVTE